MAYQYQQSSYQPQGGYPEYPQQQHPGWNVPQPQGLLNQILIFKQNFTHFFKYKNKI